VYEKPRIGGDLCDGSFSETASLPSAGWSAFSLKVLGLVRMTIRETLDRDTKYTQSFRAIIASGQVEPLVLPARSPNLNAHAERWVRSVKEECLLCAEAGWLVLVNAWLRLERAYLKLRLFLRV
jgi:hypothetical protein